MGINTESVYIHTHAHGIVITFSTLRSVPETTEPGLHPS